MAERVAYYNNQRYHECAANMRTPLGTTKPEDLRA